ncbi:hypothetical protein [Tortoise microvirus 39]|nr:hypothetical protein [Tortoise microvirus 39]
MLMIVKSAGRKIATALLARAGVVGAAWLVTQGVPEELAKQLAMAGGVLAGLLWDVAFILYQGREEVR